MKVNTDSVLLGAWTQIPENAKNILDIGTGTGVLALMMAHKNNFIEIDAIEIEKNAAEEAKENFKNSKWNNRIKSYFIPLQSFLPKTKYDCIITNPPYFINALKNTKKNKSLARHTESLSFEEIIYFCAKNMTCKGMLSLILPKQEAEIFQEIAKKEELFLTRICFIRPTVDKEFNRVLMEFSLKKKEFQKEEMEIYQAKNVYSKKHFELTKEFYLNK